MNVRTYTCGCGQKFTWTSGTEYHDVILAAHNFLLHRHDHATPQCLIPRRSDEFQALDDIKWAANAISLAVMPTG